MSHITEPLSRQHYKEIPRDVPNDVPCEATVIKLIQEHKGNGQIPGISFKKTITVCVRK